MITDSQVRQESPCNRRVRRRYAKTQEATLSGAALVSRLKQCGNIRDLQGGKVLHTNAKEAGYHRNPYIAAALITMYGKCGSMKDAWDVFENMVEQDVVSWTALIHGYVENGEGSVALDAFNSMDCAPNAFTFVSVIKALAGLATESKLDKKTCLQKAVSIHKQAKEHGFDKDVFVASTLVDMYSKCGDMTKAREVFNGMAHRNVVSWTTLILGYVENGESSSALEIFNGMECLPNGVTFVAALKACVGLAMNSADKKSCLRTGVAIHRQARERGFDKDVFVASTLVDMYSKCGDMAKAREVFDRMIHRSVVSWNVLLLGYVENGEILAALDVFNSMDCAPDNVTFLSALKACVALAVDGKLDKRTCIDRGITIHREVKEHGFDKNVLVANTLVDMYSKLGRMLQAKHVFDSMTERSVVSWTVLILGYVENGESLTALDVFNSMDCAPDSLTFVAAIKACAALASDSKLDKRACLQKGIVIHGKAREHGYCKDVIVVKTLIGMYGKCGDMLRAREVFDKVSHRDVISWNALILGYVVNGENSVALDMFYSMECPPDGVTFVAALKACIGLDIEICVQKGAAVHRRASECGFEKDVFVANTLVEMYSKFGDMREARGVFDGMMYRDVVSWTVLILGYVENGESALALEVFNSMDCAPNRVTFVAALKACASLGALETGQRIHDHVGEFGLEQDEMVASSLVDFYGKCGNMAAAEEVLNRMHSKDIVSWNALIGGYTLLGDITEVLRSVKRMEESSVQVNSVTMLLILTACSHTGNVEEGEAYFQSMLKYGIYPTLEHYTCMVDMLGRANRLEEALSLMRDMPFEGDSHIWMSLLGACWKWCNVEIGKVAFHALLSFTNEEDITAAFVLMRNIYKKLGMKQEEVHN